MTTSAAADTTTTSVQLPRELHDELRAAAAEHDRSFGWIIRKALRDWLTANDGGTK